MVISDKYEYVFFQRPRTACSTTGAILEKYYGGVSILEKHSTYSDFLKYASIKQKSYQIFSGRRNPLDQMVTQYYRLLNGSIENQRVASDFKDFLTHFDDSLFNRYFRNNNAGVQFYITYENINEDFSKMLKMCGIKQTHAFPRKKGGTSGKGYYLNEYDTPELRRLAVSKFSEMMRIEGYDFPKEWFE